jgi:hypothetical protein
MALISTTDEFMSEMSGLEPHKSFAKAKSTAYSAGVIEEVADKYFTELLNEESQSLRFAFYGAIFSLKTNDSRIADLVELVSGRDVNGLLSLMLRMVGNPDSIEKEYSSKVWKISRSNDRVISSLDELTGRGESGWTYDISWDEVAEDYFEDEFLADDFINLCMPGVISSRDYLVTGPPKLSHSYPLELYLAIANPRITFECELPDIDTETYPGDWGRAYTGYEALPEDLLELFSSACRANLFYRYLKLVQERWEDQGSDDHGIFEWDPYPALLFTRPDLSEEQCAEFILKVLDQSPSSRDVDILGLIDEGIWDNSEEAWTLNLEIASLYTTSAEAHQKVFEVGSTILNLALLLNPTISQDLRKQINSSGIKLEFRDRLYDPDYDNNMSASDVVEHLIAQAQEFKDSGLVAILRSVVEDDRNGE